MITIHTVTSNLNNECTLHCKDKYTLEQMRALLQPKVIKITKIRRKSFTFTTEKHEDLQERINDMQEASSEIVKKASIRMFFRKRKHFWLFWGAFWGVWDFSFEVYALWIEGDFKKSLLWGICGLLIVLSSLANYWRLDKTQNEFMEKGNL